MTAPQTPAPRTPGAIADRIVDAILAGRIAAGQRLGEQSLADLFGCSRTLVREALARLSARGMVKVHARRGWYVVEPTDAEAREAFAARIAIETGLVQTLPAPLAAPAVKTLRRHLADERAAIRSGDPGRRSYLLGEFHVCLAASAGNPLLAEILKDLTARTTLIATLYQSTHAAERSCADHARIVAALEAGDHALAARRLREHIEDVANHLGTPQTDDPAAALRAALLPEDAAAAAPSRGGTRSGAAGPERPAAGGPAGRAAGGGLFTDLVPTPAAAARRSPRKENR